MISKLFINFCPNLLLCAISDNFMLNYALLQLSQQIMHLNLAKWRLMFILNSPKIWQTQIIESEMEKTYDKGSSYSPLKAVDSWRTSVYFFKIWTIFLCTEYYWIFVLFLVTNIIQSSNINSEVSVAWFANVQLGEVKITSQ